jgi:hypothetical protein
LKKQFEAKKKKNHRVPFVEIERKVKNVKK